MKKLFIFFLVLPYLLFSQERQQKETIRRGGMIPAPNTQQYNRINPTPPAIEQRRSEYDQKRDYRGDFRSQSRPNNGGNHYYYAPPGVNRWNYYDPFWDWNFGGWGWNRWNRWGAPNWYNYWNPYYYYDDWGYRQPGRVYVRDNGAVDTVRGVKPRVSIGIQANQREAGVFMTVGRKTYFLAEYTHNYQKDKSKYYEDLTRDVVIPWQDKRLEDITKGGTLYLGLGQRFGRTGINAAIGFATERVRYQYYDELFVLSNNGNYSFPSYTDSYLTMKLGAMHDLKSVTIKADYELARNLFTVGVGVNF